MSKDSESIAYGLWNKAISPSNYGDTTQYYQHAFEQYKLFVDSADKVSHRRNLANTYFLTLHTFLLSAVAFIYEKGPKLENPVLYVFTLLAALVFCYVWWRLLRSYRQLNAAKFKVIAAFEEKLPASPFWNAEWQELGRGNDPKLYKPLSDVENWVPLVFVLLYLFIGVLILSGGL